MIVADLEFDSESAIAFADIKETRLDIGNKKQQFGIVRGCKIVLAK